MTYPSAHACPAADNCPATNQPASSNSGRTNSAAQRGQLPTEAFPAQPFIFRCWWPCPYMAVNTSTSMDASKIGTHTGETFAWGGSASNEGALFRAMQRDTYQLSTLSDPPGEGTFCWAQTHSFWKKNQPAFLFFEKAHPRPHKPAHPDDHPKHT